MLLLDKTPPVALLTHTVLPIGEILRKESSSPDISPTREEMTQAIGFARNRPAKRNTHRIPEGEGFFGDSRDKSDRVPK
jgi:hypothetical protein